MSAGTGAALRTGIGRVPNTLRWGQLIGESALAGIGFTVAPFVTDLALDDPALVNQAKIGFWRDRCSSE
ncbi:Na+/H+ antiporter NhaA [Pseudonocardia saturnea]